MRAPNLRKSAPYKKMQKNVKTHTINGQTKKPPGRTTAIPRKNLHTAISVNTPKLSVTKHDQN